jgi:hypothetical protein
MMQVTSVAEPEPVELQLFAGAGAEVILARLRVCKFLKNVTKTLKFTYKNHNFIAIYRYFKSLKNLLIFIYVFKKHEIFLKP